MSLFKTKSIPGVYKYIKNCMHVVPANKNNRSKCNLKIEGDLKSCRTELGKLRKQMQQMERSHVKNVRDLHSKLDRLLQQDNSIQSQHSIPTMNPIGILESCFPEKNGTPRQGSISPTSKAKVNLLKKKLLKPLLIYINS